MKDDNIFHVKIDKLAIKLFRSIIIKIARDFGGKNHMNRLLFITCFDILKDMLRDFDKFFPDEKDDIKERIKERYLTFGDENGD